MSLQPHQTLKNFQVLTHPLVAHKMSELRNVKTGKKQFAELVKEISLFLAYEVTKDLPLITREIDTPLESYEAPVLAGKKPTIVPILRAGLGMVDGFLTLMPAAKVGHIGLFRNEKTLQPECYYLKLPADVEKRPVYVCDPMLATGGSAIITVDRLKSRGVTNITMVCLVAAPEGVKNFITKHPDIPVIAAALDRQLNANGYILPGLGDAGDRLFGTK